MDEIARIKRNIARVALPLAVISAIGGIRNVGTQPGATALDEYLMYFQLIGLALAAVWIWLERQPRGWPEVLACMVLLVTAGGRLLGAIFGPNSHLPMLEFMPTTNASIPLVLIVCFVILDARRALWLAISFWLVTSTAVGYFAVEQSHRFDESHEMMLLLQQFLLWHVLIIALLYMIPMIQRRYEHAQAEAEMRKARDRAEASIRATHERLYLAMSSSGVCTWYWDVQTGGVDVDEHFEPLFGLKKDDFGGDFESFTDLIHSRDRWRMRALLCESVESGQAINTEFQIERPDGQKGVLALNARVHKEGEARSVSGAIWDISERKQAQMELHDKAQQLARSNEDLEQFAYAASHDLQEPLRGISGFASLLQERYAEKIGEDGLEYLHFISAGANRAQRLISDLLEYSRVGRKNLSYGPVDVMQMMQKVEHDLHTRIEETSAVIEYENLPSVMGSESELHRLFQNLIGNALKFTAEGTTPKVCITAEDAGAYWDFSVQDNGIGIAPEHQDRIFQIFQRLHRDEYDGTGIGLAVCKKIVNHHGGELRLTSQVGAGATFSFNLPKEEEKP